MKRYIFTLLIVTVFLTGCSLKKSEPAPTEAKLTPSLVVPNAKYVPSPMVDRYKDVTTCEGREDWQDCYANMAVNKSDPSLCLKMEPGLNDICLQYYYLQKNDPKVCSTLPKKGIIQTCEKYYKSLEK